jgi:hypothetical protein
MARPTKDWPYWKALVLRDWPSRLILTALVGFCGFVWAHGKDAITGEGQKLVLETVRPSMDSMRTQIDTLKTQVKDLQAEQDKSARVQQEFFGAMMEAIPGLKKAVQDRGKQNAEVVTKKAETETLLNNLTEIKP